MAANLWPYAVMCFVFVRNRLPSMTRLSPMELITGRRPNIHYFRIFGCRTHVHIHEEERSKSNRFKTKHVELRYHLVRDYVTRKLLKFQYIPTEENIADIFTKPLDKSIFEKHRDSLLKKPPLDSSELDTNQVQVQENANASS